MDEQTKFSVEEAARLAGIAVRTLNNWYELDLLPPSWPAPRRGMTRMYSFRDLIVIKLVAELRDEDGLGIERLRPIVSYVRTRRGSTLSLADVTLVVRGGTVSEAEGPIAPGASRALMIPLQEIVSTMQRRVRKAAGAAA